MYILSLCYRRWGVVNKDAVEAGETGVSCRGYERDVAFIWSLASGKRVVIDNGKEVHCSIGRVGEITFQHSWIGYNNHVFTIIAYASPPVLARPAGSKQFELLIDGMSFDSLPRIFELGTKNVMKYVTSPSPPTRSPSFAVSPTSIDHNGSKWCETRSQKSFQSHDQEGMQFAQPLVDVFANESGRSINTDTIESERSLNIETTIPKQICARRETTRVHPVEADLLCISSSKSSPPLPPSVGEESLLDLESPTPTASSSTIDELASLWEQPTSSSPSPSQSTSPTYNNCNPSQPPSYEAVWESMDKGSNNPKHQDTMLLTSYDSIVNL